MGHRFVDLGEAELLANPRPKQWIVDEALDVAHRGRQPMGILDRAAFQVREPPQHQVPT